VNRPRNLDTEESQVIGLGTSPRDEQVERERERDVATVNII